MLAYGVLKTVYSPFKAFKKIIEDSTYRGPVLIMGLFVAANIASVYVTIPNIYVEQTLPPCSQMDVWTENSTLWTSNAATLVPSQDSIKGACYGNSSIESHVDHTNQVWVQLNIPEPVNCSGAKGYKNMSFRIKVASSSFTVLRSSSLVLYSGSSGNYRHNLTDEVTPLKIGVWYNFTINTGPESTGWDRSSDQASWENITGIRFEFRWPEDTDVTLRLDGLFFRGVFNSELENSSRYILNSLLSSFMQFTIRWIVLSGIIYVMSKTVGDKMVWRTLLIVMGFTLIPLIIQVLANTALYTTLPNLYYPLEYFSGSSTEFETAQTTILEQTQVVGQIASYIQIAMSIWTIGLSTIALRLLAGYSWIKGISFSIPAYFISQLVESFLLGY